VGEEAEKVIGAILVVGTFFVLLAAIWLAWDIRRRTR